MVSSITLPACVCVGEKVNECACVCKRELGRASVSTHKRGGGREKKGEKKYLARDN